MPPPAVHVALFGVPRVLQGGHEIALPVRKTLALFVYLSIEGRSSRARLAELFWGDLDEATARRNLRRALHRLRATALDGAIDADDAAVGLAGVRTDLEDFDDAVAQGRLADALALRAGVFCDGLELDAAPSFDDWLQRRRERFERDWRAGLARLAAQRERAGDLRGALAAQGSLLEDDRLQEATYRELMRLHDALGERSAALEVYAAAVTALRDELGLEPLAETRLLAERIRARQEAAPAQPAAAATPLGGIDLRAAPLVAREREMATIAAATAPLVLIVGEAGIGKTRLAQEAASAAAVVVRFSEMWAATPFYAVADALRRPAHRALLAALAPAWRRELARLLPELDAPAATADDTAAEARLRLLEALWQALSAAGSPIVFDDVHWADASSIELIAHMARRSAAAGGVPRLLATARGVELADHAAAAQAFDAMAAEGLLLRIALGGFDDWSMLQLVHGLSRSGGGARFAARLAAATGGNVFFALETIRALLEAGELVVGADAGWSTRYDDTTTDYAELPLPASVVDAVRARVARLGGAALRLLETAALAEDGSTLAEIQGATALADTEALEGIERAIAARVLERAGPGYRFAHELFRAAIRSGLSPERQRLTHARLAAVLEPLKAAPARIAAHWQAAGDAPRAAAAWVRAGEAAMVLHAHREAATHFERAAELTADRDAALVLYDRAIERLLRIRSGLEESGALVARLLDRIEREGGSSLKFDLLARAGEAASHARRDAEAAHYARRALASGPASSPAIHLHALSITAFSEARLGWTEASLAGYRVAIDYARAQGIERGVAMMAGSATDVAVRLDRLDEAAGLRDLALAVAERVMPGDVRHANVLSRTSTLPRARGDRATALQQLALAIEIGQRTKSSMQCSVYFANQCETLVDDGRAAEAAAGHVQLAALAEPASDFEMDYLLALTRAAIDEGLGRLGDAVTQARAAAAAADRYDGTPDRREARFLGARIMAALGAHEAARALAEEAARFVPDGWPSVLLPLALHRAAARLDAGAPDEAQAIITTALPGPYCERVLQPVLQAAQVLVARCELASGRPEAVQEALRGVDFSIALEADAWCVRVQAAQRLGAADEIAAAAAWLDASRVPPLNALALMAALAQALPKRSAAAWRTRAAAAAQVLADSLNGEPALQSAFIRQHRDLLT